MTWRVVVADRVAKSGLDLLSQTPDIEVVDVAGKPAELDKAVAGAHALIVRSETRVTAAQLARAFGMQVVGHDPYLLPERAGELHVRLLSLEALLRAADVVTLHVALTDQTHHLIDATSLKLMKPTALLINTARGELVDEAALAEAIRERRIGGAAIDVFAVEPLPADSPLRSLDRVILTPHLAASTAEAQERVATEICSAVREALVAGDLSFAINVPGMGGDLLRRLAPLLDLARRLGRL